MYKFVYGFLLVIVLGSSGCSDWLDVQPKTTSRNSFPAVSSSVWR